MSDETSNEELIARATAELAFTIMDVALTLLSS